MRDTNPSTDRERIPVSIPKPAARMIARAAARRHKSKSAFIRDAAIEAAEEVLSAPAVIDEGAPAISAA